MTATAIVEVVTRIIDILARHGHEEKAAWLSQRVDTLRTPTAVGEEIRSTLDELHSIVLGMDGLFDLRLDEVPGHDAVAAREILDGLADRLFELTR